jgi:hypothetical protein
MSAPLESRTMPVTEAEESCPYARPALKTQAKANRVTFFMEILLRRWRLDRCWRIL